MNHIVAPRARGALGWMSPIGKSLRPLRVDTRPLNVGFGVVSRSDLSPAQLFHSWIAALARRPWLPSESPNDLIARHRHPPSGRATFQHKPPRHEAEPQAIVEHREVLAGRHGPCLGGRHSDDVWQQNAGRLV
jgi:hypothetical protein